MTSRDGTSEPDETGTPEEPSAPAPTDDGTAADVAPDVPADEPDTPAGADDPAAPHARTRPIGPGPVPDDGADADRDWDAEWRSIAAELGPARPRYLRSDTPVIGALSSPRDYAPPEDPDADRFVPDDPEPVGRDRVALLAWAMIAAGPVLMLLAVVAFDRASPWYVATCLGLFLVGCGIGFTRLPGRRDHDSGDGSAV